MEQFKLTQEALDFIIDSLDDTGGFIIKEKELRYWIEYFVNLDRQNRACPN